MSRTSLLLTSFADFRSFSILVGRSPSGLVETRVGVEALKLPKSSLLETTSDLVLSRNSFTDTPMPRMNSLSPLLSTQS